MLGPSAILLRNLGCPTLYDDLCTPEEFENNQNIYFECYPAQQNTIFEDLSQNTSPVSKTKKKESDGGLRQTQIISRDGISKVGFETCSICFEVFLNFMVHEKSDKFHKCLLIDSHFIVTITNFITGC